MAVEPRTEAENNKAFAPMTSDREILIERWFDAPRELVWSAWTDPKHVDKWWGPNGFRNQTHSMDFKVGGTWRYTMHGPDGKAWPNWIRFTEIKQPERLAYEHGGEENEPAHFSTVVTFTAQGNRTKIAMLSIFPSAEACAAVKKFGAVAGGEQTLARLAGFLPFLADGTAENAMVLSRLFDAPVGLVFEAWSTPQALMRWWGPKGFTTPVCEVDFRVGGAYRMAMRDGEGRMYPFHGSYREIVTNKKIVLHAIIDHLPNVEVVTTVTFEDVNGKTLLTVRQDWPSDDAAAKGQTEGWSGSLEKLALQLEQPK